MKAFVVFGEDIYDGCLLVFAETANKARHIGAGGWFHWDYIETHAWRQQDYDQYAKDAKSQVIDCNDELPDGAPPFYTDVEI